MGTTPLLIDLPPGSAKFELRLSGHDALTVRKELLAGQSIKLDLSLAKTIKAKTVKPALTGKSKNRPVTQVKETEKTDSTPTKTDPPANQDSKAVSADPSSTSQDKAPAGYKSNPFD